MTLAVGTKVGPRAGSSSIPVDARRHVRLGRPPEARELGELARAEAAQHGEVLEFVEQHGLAGSGLGWVDVHLLVSAALSGVGIWTLDRRLSIAAQRLSLFA